MAIASACLMQCFCVDLSIDMSMLPSTFWLPVSAIDSTHDRHNFLYKLAQCINVCWLNYKMPWKQYQIKICCQHLAFPSLTVFKFVSLPNFWNVWCQMLDGLLQIWPLRSPEQFRFWRSVHWCRWCLNLNIGNPLTWNTSHFFGRNSS